jgi:hypothetical protein
MANKIDEAECTSEAILESFVMLDLPDARSYTLTSQDGRRLYLDAWHKFKRESTTLEHKLAVRTALARRDGCSQVIAKVSKYVRRSSDFASRAIEVYQMFGDVAQAREEDPRNFIWLLGKPRDAQRQEAAVDRKMTKISETIIKQYDRLWHERELLLTQIQVVAPQMAALIGNLR